MATALTTDRTLRGERPASPPPAVRHHHLDFLRAGLMLGGIPYHAALAFGGTAWVVSSPHSTTVLQLLSQFIHVWRMPAFFLVAGFFAAMALSRRNARTWVGGRVRRLGWPLLFCLLTINPLQLLAAALYGSPSIAAGMRVWAAQMTTLGPHWILHLWFIRDLVIFSLVTAALVPLARSRAGRQALAWLTGGRARLVAVILGLTVGGTLAWGAWVKVGVAVHTVGIIEVSLLHYAPAYLLGMALHAHSGSLQPTRVAGVPLYLPVALALTAASMLHPAQPGALSLLSETAVDIAAGLACSVALVAACQHLVTRPSPRVRWLVDASLPIYLVHHLAVVAFAALVIPAGGNPLVGFTVVCALAFVVSAAAYEGALRVPALNFALTGSRRRGLSIVDLRRGRKGD